MKYTVEFTLFNKEMRVKIFANSALEAKQKVKNAIINKIIFTNIIPEISDDPSVNFFKDIFNM